MDNQFRGRFEIKLDAKGRLSLPPALRHLLQDAASGTCHLVLTNSQYLGKRCLHGYSLTQWKELEARIAKLPALKPEVQAFQRFYLSGAQIIEVDAQNRVLVPSVLRKYAGLNAELTLVGMGDKFELWDGDTWNTVHEQLATSFEDTLAAVSALEEAQ